MLALYKAHMENGLETNWTDSFSRGSLGLVTSLPSWKAVSLGDQERWSCILIGNWITTPSPFLSSAWSQPDCSCRWLKSSLVKSSALPSLDALPWPENKKRKTSCLNKNECGDRDFDLILTAKLYIRISLCS